MHAVDNLFADMMKMPTIFGSNMLDRIFSTEPKEQELEEVSSLLEIRVRLLVDNLALFEVKNRTPKNLRYN